MQETIAQEFYTWASLGTLAGASGAIIVVSNTFRKLTKIDSPWVGFVVSVLIAIVGALESEKLGNAGDYILVLLNSCLLFCTAAGMNDALSELRPVPEGQLRPYGRRTVGWLSPWLKSN